MFKAKKTDDAVSPVIGVILLVAVTVALVALATVIVFDIGSDVSDTADATVQLDQVDDGVQATVIRNENVDEFTLSGPYSDTEKTNTDYFEEDDTSDYDFGTDNVLSNVGDTAFYPAEIWDEDDPLNKISELNDGDTISVITTLEDGSDEVLTSTDYNNSGA